MRRACTAARRRKSRGVISLFRILTAGACLALLASGHAAERDVNRVFPVQPGCRLKLDSYRGSVTIVESDEPAVSVAVHLEIGGDTEADAARLLAGLQLDLQSVDNGVTIFARNPRETRLRWSWREDEQIDLTYRISVPRRCDVDLNVTNGSIVVGNLTGRMTARTETGAIFFRHIDGSIDARTDSGDVIVSRCSGKLTVRVGKGLIRAGTVAGAADLRNSSGDVELLGAGSTVNASAEAGDLFVGFGREIGGDAQLRTNGGSIVVRIDPAANCRIDAAATWSRVHTALPLTIEAGGDGKSRLVGRFNQGGPLLLLRASGGPVKLERGEVPFQ